MAASAELAPATTPGRTAVGTGVPAASSRVLTAPPSDGDPLVLTVEDAELLGGPVEDPLHREGVRERHHGALRAAGAQALRDLDQLVAVPDAERWQLEGLGLPPGPAQHERPRVVEPGLDLDPAARPVQPRGTGLGVAERHQQRVNLAVLVAEEEPGLRVDAGRRQRTAHRDARR